MTEHENAIKQLSSEVFDTLGVQDEGKTLEIAVKGLDGFQDNLKSSMDALVKQVYSTRIIEIAMTITADDYRGYRDSRCNKYS